MPTAPPKPCTHVGCPELTTTGRCEAHKHDGWKRHQAGKTSTERGYGAEWRKLRARVLSRDKGLCQVCLKSGKYTPAKEVDHIVPKSQGGTDDINQLQAICVSCHRAKTASERNA